MVGELALGGLIDGVRLADAATGYPATVVQRAGWLIEFMAAEVDATVDLGDLAELVATREYTVLDPRSAADGHRDTRWRVLVNTDVEHRAAWKLIRQEP